jgi:serine/threonine-protein kinase RsbW
MAEIELEITVAAATDQIPIVTKFVEEVMIIAGFEMQEILAVQLAVEEACTNIALYAYPGKDGGIRIFACVTDDRLELTIEDEGVPFDPTAYRKIQPQVSAEDRPIGGLGIYLVQSYMDRISYKFKNGKNTLKLVKNMHPDRRTGRAAKS